MQITSSIKGLKPVQTLMDRLSRSKVREASVKAVNDTGFEVRRAMQEEMRSVFDRPTDYILRSPMLKRATVDKPMATIEPEYMGGKGVDPKKILKAQNLGGKRRDKRSEVALRRAGILPKGYQTAIPAEPFPGSEDRYGNLKGGFIVQLLSYFRSFGEQGYRANMTDARRKALQLRGGAGVRKVGPNIGRRYILAYGKLRGGARWTAKGENDRRASNLAPGIWAVVGSSGADIRPVLMFVRSGNYQERLDMEKVGQRADVENYLSRRIRYRMRQAAGV
ncbi:MULTISPECIES: hypothetical protein [unclassified Comamonas]|uniref:hypothetical protein n=1 Tax=unclassified Comamonas TaxID=2638500 RepID=UPI001FA7A829|nr:MULTISPECIES: hypothetical protein [unclassified Comamonas]UNV89393.1 hypothetical protein MP576_17515 [Comamonas sp. 7D-2evo1]UNV97309.1 hypothetical protein MPZ60_08890 [Comamonas sp. 7D-2]UNV99037.1 hypothetical protein MP579_17520 [Comamonas sp. 7D-2evo2]